ncbi:GNAT family N-acetyltransferase [Mycolicibacterium sediminis]|uniref:Acetyltransferase n=1 Tax=Mycolicibacterium sediminis TaxID=1286180 RepID=A0A7I7QJH6_9MYCO|nr:GNAT family N-acetyltransferase [Mycolicibacterium sediminis]BBY26463.1 acetyltransferase [Mycolicibacterium sediminis]
MTNTEPRPATADDVRDVTELVAAAFEKYVERIGKQPAPMLSDYAALVDDGTVWVVDNGGAVAGMMVAVARADHLLVDTVAVSPDAVGLGLGRILLDRAERLAAELDLPEVRLSTNEAMTENLDYYPRRGYRETGRGLEDGYRRVFFAKAVRPAPRR